MFRIFSNCLLLHTSLTKIVKPSRRLYLLRWSQIRLEHISSMVTKRPPVVTIMGHVDHGKTTLIDNLRNSKIVQQEFGGITQHIGAFVVPFKQANNTELVTFLDTPGHAAFAAMRQRGANITDIVVLVVACEDGVLDQTIESIKYAKNSNVPIIVALNKVDKIHNPKQLESRVALVRQQLIVHDVVLEADGGEVQMVQISALKGFGIDDLKEAILALAETLDLKADLAGEFRGCVIESRVDQHRGKVCTILVQNGQLKKGDYIVSGDKNWARVRALFDERNQLRQTCSPGLPIQVTGWREKEVPSAGDSVIQVESEAEAKSVINRSMQIESARRAVQDAEAAMKRDEEHRKVYRINLQRKLEQGYRYGRIMNSVKGIRLPEDADHKTNDCKISLILKCDVDGSLEALLDLMDTYDKHGKQPVKLDVMHFGVGNITENDITMASSFPNSIIYGFNVGPIEKKLLVKAKQEGVTLRMFNVIYHLFDDLKSQLEAKMPELEQELEIGRATVLQEFIVTLANKRESQVAGCRCIRGSLKREANFRLLRGQQVLADNLEVQTMKHFKDDAKEIIKEQECGISFISLDKSIQFKPGDILVSYERRQYKPKLKWELKGFS